MVYRRRRTFKKRSLPRYVRKTKIPLETGRMGWLTRKVKTPMTHSFKRYTTSGYQIVGNVAYAPFLASWNVSLGNVVNVADFSSLFDQYRINFCVVKFWLKIDPSAQTSATASFPKLYWYRDYDDTNAPSNLQEIRENAKCKIAVMYPNRPVTIKFKPNSLQLLYQSAIANQFKPAFGQWMDMSTTNTTHYGFKYAIDDLTNTNYKVDVETLLYFQCRQPR